MKRFDIKLGETYFAKHDGKTIIVKGTERVSRDGLIRCNHLHSDDVLDIHCRQFKTVASVEDIEKFETEWLLSLEVSIAEMMQEFMTIGHDLRIINDNKLYKRSIDEHVRTSFEEYCEHRLGMSRQQAYRLIDAAVVVANLSPIGDKTDLPQNESQCRELNRLSEPKEQQKTWKELWKKWKRQPTALEIKTYIEQKERNNLPPTAALPPPPTAPVDPRPDVSDDRDDTDDIFTAPVDPRPDVSNDTDDIVTAPVDPRPDVSADADDNTDNVPVDLRSDATPALRVVSIDDAEDDDPVDENAVELKYITRQEVVDEKRKQRYGGIVKCCVLEELKKSGVEVLSNVVF